MPKVTEFKPYNKQPLTVREARVNLMVTGAETIYVPENADVRLSFVAGTIDNESVLGTLTTAPQVSLDTGTGGETYTAVKTLTSGAQDRGFVFAAATQPYTCTGVKTIRITKDVLGVGQATATRARADGVATLTTGASITLSVGDEITVASVGGTGYNGVYTVTAVNSATSFSYLNAGDDEGSAADTAGRVGAYTVIIKAVFA